MKLKGFGRRLGGLASPTDRPTDRPRPPPNRRTDERKKRGRFFFVLNFLCALAFTLSFSLSLKHTYTFYMLGFQVWGMGMICLSHRETKHPDLKFVSYCKGYEFSSDKNNVAHSSCLTLNTDYFRPIPRSVYHCNMTSLFYFCLLRSRDEMRLTHANFVLL